MFFYGSMSFFVATAYRITNNMILYGIASILFYSLVNSYVLGYIRHNNLDGKKFENKDKSN